MPDEPDSPINDPDGMPEAKEPGGIMLYLAIALIVIAVFLVFFLNPMGQGATSATLLTQNAWSLQSFADPDGTVIPVQNGTAILAIFSPLGKLNGGRSCSAYSGRYMVQETGIVISRITRGSPECLQSNATQQDMHYYASLEDAAFLRVSHQELTLYGTNGKPLLTFTPARSGP
jgi:hypothetical protein